MGRTLGNATGEDDPLARAIAPPPDETPEARAQREQVQANAKKRSDEIDARLQAENAAKRKRGQPVKLLLLGQSESGKSTTLKNFQLTYARKAWTAEKDAWRAVIQLNLVRSINTLAASLARELERDATPSESSSEPNSNENSDAADAASILTTPTLDPEADPEAKSSSSSRPVFALTESHRELIARLSPLRPVQRSLEIKLGAGASEEYGDPLQPDPSAFPDSADLPADATSVRTSVVSFRDITNERERPASSPTSGSASVASPGALLRARKSQEFFVRSNGWKSALQRFRSRTRTSRDGPVEGDGDTLAIARARADMKILWTDRTVREIVRERNVRLLECGEFFLDALERVADPRYVPSDDDIIRARLRTVGVQEHSIILDSGPEPGREWLIYDVGGSRSLRAQWPAYFDDVHAILFLAPINCFDERLAEDARANRLDDSLQLWKLVCGHRLLRRTELVLFLNKIDLLEKKLKGGVRFGAFVKSYEGENEAEQVMKFLKTKFMDVCRHYSKEHRGLHVYFTSVIDTKATARTLSAVQDGILRSNLRHLSLI